MTKKLKAGDRVSWKSHGGKAHGHVIRRITEPLHIKGHTAAASSENPEFVVETDGGARAAHKPGALKRT